MSVHILPVPDWCIISQTFAEHEARAANLGLCSRPGAGCKGYYYGAIDYAPPFDRVDEMIQIKTSIGGIASVQNQGKSGYGLHVRLAVPGSGELVIFGHLSIANVQTGQAVKQGDHIGWMGNTGNSTGKHLHWEIREDGIPVDPALYLAAGSPGDPVAPGGLAVGDYVTTTAVPYLNVRIGPGTGNLDVGNLPTGTKLEVVKVDGDWLGVVLYVHAGYVRKA